MLEPQACPVCDGTRARRVYTKFGLPISACRECGLVAANPRLPAPEIWKRYSPEYFHQEYLPALGVHDGQFWLTSFDIRYAPLLGLIAGLHPPPGDLLEIGCGAGFFLKAAERAGWRVTGLELSADGVRFARERLGLPIRCEAAETMSLPDASVDVVVLIEVVEHLLDPRAVLQAACRVLRPGGAIVLTTPNYNAISRLVLGAQWAVLSPGEHVFYFTARTLGALLVRAGFASPREMAVPAGLSTAETMNAGWTHAPASLRARAYKAAVRTVGAWLREPVRAAGRGDTLRMVAFKADA